MKEVSLEDHLKYKILLVDDQESVTKSIERHLRNQFTFITATSGAEAMEKLKSAGKVAVIVSDFRMPGMDGIEFLKRTQKFSQDSVRIVLTGSVSQDVAAKSINECHAHSFLTKPVKIEHFANVLRDAINQHKLMVVERDIVQNTLSAAVKVLLDILQALDPNSFGQCIRAKNLIQSFASQLEHPYSWACPLAAMLCRIGVTYLPTEIRQKMIAGKALTPAERKIAGTHPRMGADLLQSIPRLDGVAEIVRYQNKNFDGGGFPEGSHSGDNIPWGARLLRIINDLVACHEKGMSNAEGLAELKQAYGYYDPDILKLVATNIKGVDPLAIEAPPTEPQVTNITESTVSTETEVPSDSPQSPDLDPCEISSTSDVDNEESV